MTLHRRAFFGALVAGAVPLVLKAQQGQRPDTTRALPNGGDAGFLANPALAGVSRPPVTARDNDPVVVGIEHRVRCPCPCGLDVYTCRTTDFTCSYSPERHREIMGLVQQGMTPDQVVATLVAKYGESTLMAPKPKGFNLLGYLVPGSLILLLGAAIVAVISARRRAGVPAVAPAPGVPPVVGATDEELARLQQALREIDG
jgi:cytochrome c-type biogenesis protein CcmH